MKSQNQAPKPDFCLLEKQAQSLPDDGISQDSNKSLGFEKDGSLKARHDRFGNQIDKKKRQQKVSFRDRIEKKQKLYDLIEFDYFELELDYKENLKQRDNQKKCCQIQ